MTVTFSRLYKNIAGRFPKPGGGGVAGTAQRRGRQRQLGAMDAVGWLDPLCAASGGQDWQSWHDGVSAAAPVRVGVSTFI